MKIQTNPRAIHPRQTPDNPRLTSNDDQLNALVPSRAESSASRLLGRSADTMRTLNNWCTTNARKISLLATGQNILVDGKCIGQLTLSNYQLDTTTRAFYGRRYFPSRFLRNETLGAYASQTGNGAIEISMEQLGKLVLARNKLATQLFSQGCTLDQKHLLSQVLYGSHESPEGLPEKFVYLSGEKLFCICKDGLHSLPNNLAHLNPLAERLQAAFGLSRSQSYAALISVKFLQPNALDEATFIKNCNTLCNGIDQPEQKAEIIHALAQISADNQTKFVEQCHILCEEANSTQHGRYNESIISHFASVPDHLRDAVFEQARPICDSDGSILHTLATLDERHIQPDLIKQAALMSTGYKADIFIGLVKLREGTSGADILTEHFFALLKTFTELDGAYPDLCTKLFSLTKKYKHKISNEEMYYIFALSHQLMPPLDNKNGYASSALGLIQIFCKIPAQDRSTFFNLCAQAAHGVQSYDGICAIANALFKSASNMEISTQNAFLAQCRKVYQGVADPKIISRLINTVATVPADKRAAFIHFCFDQAEDGVANRPEELALPLHSLQVANFDLTGSLALARLPAQLQVGNTFLQQLDIANLDIGHLNLNGCVNLQLPLPTDLYCKKLTMYAMNLAQVPEGIERIQGIKVIDLMHNQINALPDRLGALPQGTELFVENNPIPAAEIRRFRAAHPHIVLRADQYRAAAAQGAVNVHDRAMVNHFQTLYRKLDQLLGEKNLPMVSAGTTQLSLSTAATRYKTPSAIAAISFMLAEQRNRGVMDFDTDITSDKVLCKVWTWIQAQPEQEDRDNGTENLIQHLAIAKNHCSTRHAEEALLALQDSYGASLIQSAEQFRAKRNDNEANDPKIKLSVLDAVGYFMRDMLAFLKTQIAQNEAVSDDALLETLSANIYNELAPQHKNVNDLEGTVKAVIQYLAKDWSTFVEMARE